jgi:hypothetical protein
MLIIYLFSSIFINSLIDGGREVGLHVVVVKEDGGVKHYIHSISRAVVPAGTYEYAWRPSRYMGSDCCIIHDVASWGLSMGSSYY